MSGGTSHQLAVDAARFLPFGRDHVQTTAAGDLGVQFDVGPAPGHIGGDGDRLRLTCLGDQRRFILILHPIQDLVRYAMSLQDFSDRLALSNRAASDEYGPAGRHELLSGRGDRGIFVCGSSKVAAGPILAAACDPFRNDDDR